MTTANLVKELFESGAHFGHQTFKWNPKMKPYIFTKKSGIHILNLEKTADLLQDSLQFLSRVVSNGGKILFVGTKKQVKDAIMKTSQELEMPYVNERWLGGMLTNNPTIRQSLKKLDKYLKMEEDGSFASLPKKEQAVQLKEKTKLVKNLSGIKTMPAMPAVLFIVDPKHEVNAVLEAKKLKIPIVAVLDTNCDPDNIDYVIPSNDDSVKSVEYILGKVKDAVLSGREIWVKKEEARVQEEARKKAEDDAKREELKKKAEEARKVKEKKEQEEKAKAEAIIADLEKSK